MVLSSGCFVLVVLWRHSAAAVETGIELPVVELGSLSGSSLASAFGEFGAVSVEGIDVDEVLSAVRQVFEVSDEEKQRSASRPEDPVARGYISQGGESGSLEFVEAKEGFSFGHRNGTTNRWPPNINRTVLENAFVDLCVASRKIVEALTSRFPGLEGCCDKDADATSLARLFHYFPVASVDRRDNSVLGSSPHTDWGMLTFVLSRVSILRLLSLRVRRRIPKPCKSGTKANGARSSPGTVSSSTLATIFRWSQTVSRIHRDIASFLLTGKGSRSCSSTILTTTLPFQLLLLLRHAVSAYSSVSRKTKKQVRARTLFLAEHRPSATTYKGSGERSPVGRGGGVVDVKRSFPPRPPEKGVFVKMVLLLVATAVLRHVAALDTLSSGLASMARMPVALGSSTTVSENSLSQLRDVVFYDGGESDATSREIRECCTYLDLSVLVYPSGRGSRTERKARSLVLDGESYGGAEVVSRLLSLAGDRSSANGDDASHFLASALRFGKGNAVDLSRAPLAPPPKPLELYNYEGNQFCRLVREVLFELDLPYRSIACGKGSSRREELALLSGSTTCPYLVDPNTGVSMAESADIASYLETTYAVSPRARDNFERRAMKAELTAFAVQSHSGMSTLNGEDRERFDDVLSKLVACNPTSTPALSSKLDGEWVLLWTTETELLFLMKNGLPGARCTTVTQTIDSASNRLVNYVGCGDSSFLKVDSYLGGGGDDNLDFEFNACSLKCGQLPTVPLPPVGKGNFQIAYLDDDFRVQFDSRGDTLISTRAMAVKEAPYLR